MNEEITKQIGRFGLHPGVAESQEDAARQIGELRRAFAANCESPEMLCAVADELMRTQRYFPLPVDVELAAQTVRREGRAVSKSEACQRCGGTGWSGRKVVRRDGQNYDFAIRCACVSQRQEVHA